jgi:GNAT superfamily N-acetyltransferase
VTPSAAHADAACPGPGAAALARLATKAWRYWREHGLRQTLYRIQRRRRFAIYAKDLTRGEPVPDHPDVRFRVATADDVPLLREASAGYWDPAIDGRMDERLRSGDLAVVGVSAAAPTEVVYLSWVSSRDWLFDLVFEGRPPADQACSRRLWVPAAHRRRGLARRGLAQAEHAAAGRGIRRLWAFVLASNKPSCRLHERAGYDCRGVVRVGRCLGRRVAEVRWSGRRRWTSLLRGGPSAPADESA